MTLPRLKATVRGGRALATVLRSALLHEVQIIPLVSPPEMAGQHLLELDIPDEGIVTLLASPIGDPTRNGQALHLAPVTRPQMAALFAMIERLDVPGSSLPPTPLPSEAPPYSDRTVVHAMVFSQSDLPPSSTRRSSFVPPPLGIPPSSDRAPSSWGVGPSSYGPSSRALIRQSPTFAGSPDEVVTSRSLAIVAPSPPAATPQAAPQPIEAPAPQPAPPSSRGGEKLIGRLIAGKYRLDSIIGSGSTAAVYRATHAHLQRVMAVKLLHQTKASEKQFVQRFKGEARAASKLEHPNVMRVLDFGEEEDGFLYLVMELLDGRSLEAILAASVRIDQVAAIDIAIQTCGALAFAHREGIIHRDIKPENLMLVAHKDDDGNACDLVKVCDFGLAKLRDPDPEQEDLTTAGMLCGSPAYMSPEQARGEKLDQRTDIYAVGATLFECVTGEMPHEAMTIVELFAKKMLEPPRRPRSLVPALDEELERVILRALATDPTQRQDSARTLREDLRRVQKRLVNL